MAAVAKVGGVSIVLTHNDEILFHHQRDALLSLPFPFFLKQGAANRMRVCFLLSIPVSLF